MKADLTPADLTPAALLADGLAALPAKERERLAAAILPDFAAIVEDARRDGTLPEWNGRAVLRAAIDAVVYLADRARLLDRLEDEVPDLGRAEWEIERKRRGAVA